MSSTVSKVPEVTLTFWVIKIAATTLGETGGDAVSMTFRLGYLVSTILFAAIFLVLAAAQIRAKSFHPWLYWAVIVATTTVGTTMADFADRSLGIGYTGGASILFILVLASLGAWWFIEGTVSVNRIATPRAEMFYWITILFSNTLGTALGDFLADDGGLGYEGGSLVFGAVILLIAVAYYRTTVSRTLLFWAAFVMTRPLGATLGDTLTKPLASGGLNLSRITSSLVIAALIVACIWMLPQRAGGHPGEPVKQQAEHNRRTPSDAGMNKTSRSRPERVCAPYTPMADALRRFRLAGWSPIPFARRYARSPRRLGLTFGNQGGF